MLNKELKKLNRKQLLELLLEQTKELERLQAELEETKSKLQERNIKIQEAGNLAEAVIGINHIMENAQQAAQQYIDSIAAMETETKEKCQAMLQQAQKEAKQIRSRQRKT